MSAIMPAQLKHREIIKCVPKGKYLGNNRCHVNCLSYALKHKNIKYIHGVAQVFKDQEICAHFIIGLIDGSFFDPTYGNMSNVLYSYCISIEKYEISSFDPNRELQNLKNYLFNLQPWYYRLFKSNNY